MNIQEFETPTIEDIKARRQPIYDMMAEALKKKLEPIESAPEPKQPDN